MNSNYDSTEMCELLVSMWIALVLVTKTARVHQGFGAAAFGFVGIPLKDSPSKSELIRRNGAS